MFETSLEALIAACRVYDQSSEREEGCRALNSAHALPRVDPNLPHLASADSQQDTYIKTNVAAAIGECWVLQDRPIQVWLPGMALDR